MEFYHGSKNRPILLRGDPHQFYPDHQGFPFPSWPQHANCKRSHRHCNQYKFHTRIWLVTRILSVQTEKSISYCTTISSCSMIISANSTRKSVTGLTTWIDYLMATICQSSLPKLSIFIMPTCSSKHMKSQTGIFMLLLHNFSGWCLWKIVTM